MKESNIQVCNIKTYDDYMVIFLKSKMESLSQQFIETYLAKYPEFTVLAVIIGGKHD